MTRLEPVVPPAMTLLSYQDRASFETTKRLLAEVVNEGLVRATLKFSKFPNGTQQRFILCSNHEPLSKPQKWVEVGVRRGTYIGVQGDRVVSLLRAECLRPPVLVGASTITAREELDPDVIWKFMIPWLVDEASEALLLKVGIELKNSSVNQGQYHRAVHFLDINQSIEAYTQRSGLRSARRKNDSG